MKLENLIVALTLVTISPIKDVRALDASYRPFSPTGAADGFQYGFVNMKLYNNSALHMAPFKNVTVRNRTACAIECVMSETKCFSLMIQPIKSGLEFICMLLSSDRYRLYPLFDENVNGTEFYEIDTQCDQPKPCINQNKDNPWCIPNNYGNNFWCYCLPYYKGNYCEQGPRTTTTIVNTTGTGMKRPKYYTMEQKTKYAFSLWVRLDADGSEWEDPGEGLSDEYPEKTILHFRNFDHEVEFMIQEKNETLEFSMFVAPTGSVDIFKTTEPLVRGGGWFTHIGCNIFLEQDGLKKASCYINGTKIERDIAPDFGDYQQKSTVELRFLANLKDNIDDMPYASIKEAYLWERDLEAEEFALLAERKNFVPFNYAKEWESMANGWTQVSGNNVGYVENQPLW